MWVGLEAVLIIILSIFSNLFFCCLPNNLSKLCSFVSLKWSNKVLENWQNVARFRHLCVVWCLAGPGHIQRLLLSCCWYIIAACLRWAEARLVLLSIVVAGRWDSINSCWGALLLKALSWLMVFLEEHWLELFTAVDASHGCALINEIRLGLLLFCWHLIKVITLEVVAAGRATPCRWLLLFIQVNRDE